MAVITYSLFSLAIHSRNVSFNARPGKSLLSTGWMFSIKTTGCIDFSPAEVFLGCVVNLAFHVWRIKPDLSLLIAITLVRIYLCFRNFIR